MRLLRGLVLAGLCAVSLPVWSQDKVMDLWPQGPPEVTSFDKPEYDPTTDATRYQAGRVVVRLTNVSRPTMSMYFPEAARNAHVGALVFPGGGYDHLAWNIEGTEVCEWMRSLGVTCGVVKYRVPEKIRFPENPADLEDAQQAMRIFRSHADEWHVDSSRIGVAGFSAGGQPGRAVVPTIRLSGEERRALVCECPPGLPDPALSRKSYGEDLT